MKPQTNAKGDGEQSIPVPATDQGLNTITQTIEKPKQTPNLEVICLIISKQIVAHHDYLKTSNGFEILKDTLVEKNIFAVNHLLRFLLNATYISNKKITQKKKIKCCCFALARNI